ncbi:MAG: hypothetical protein HKN47_20015 [Pirellulaceae bacterium]|nr:hypothetical protein [Pirellulaceae bacterium]
MRRSVVTPPSAPSDMPITTRVALVATLLALSIVDSRAQAPFFDAGPDSAVDSTTDTDVPTDPLVIQLNEAARTGDGPLADAIAAFARIKLWSEADRWLTQAVAPMNDQAKLAMIADRIGPENLFRLASQEEISAEAKAAVAKLGKAARADAESKDKIVAAIDALDDPSVDRRLASARTLLGGGDVAVGALVEAAVSENPTAPREEILRALLKLSGSGEQALRQFAIYAQGAVRLNALKSVTKIDRSAAMSDLLTAIHALDTTEAEANYARVNVQPLTSDIPTASESREYLYSELQRLRRLASETENDFATVTIWTVNEDRKTISSQRARSIMLAYRDAVDAGARLRRIGSLRPQMADAILAADLSYRVMIDPDWGTSEQIAAMKSAYGDMVDAEGLSHAIAIASEKDDRPALVGLLRMIGSDLSSTQADFLLRADSPSLTPVVKATLNSDPRVRYEAAAAIARMDAPFSYAGKSLVMQRFGEMTRLEDEPLAVLVETRDEVVLRQESILSRMGYRTEVVGSVRELERVIARGGDLRLILSKTQLWDVPPVELIDRVRRMPLGKNVPILFYGDQAAGIDTDRWDAISEMMKRPKTPAAYADLLMSMDLVNRLPELTAVDRQMFRSLASDQLAARPK